MAIKPKSHIAACNQINSVSSTKSCQSSIAQKSTTLYACPYSNEDCDVIEALGLHASYVKDQIELTRVILPCQFCNKARQDAGKLHGARLGRLERQLLIASPEPTVDSSSGYCLISEKPGRSAQEALLRAARRLHALGLVELLWGVDETSKSRVKRRKIFLTPLGEQVRNKYMEELQTGKPIRWSNKLSEVANDAPWPLEKVLARLQWEIKARCFYLSFKINFSREKLESCHRELKELRIIGEALEKSLTALRFNKDTLPKIT